MLSRAPILIVVVGVAALAFGRQAASGQLAWEIADVVSSEGQSISIIVQAAYQPATGLLATVLSLLAVMAGASPVVAELPDDLNIVWRISANPSATGLSGVLRVATDRFYSFLLVVAGWVLDSCWTLSVAVADIRLNWSDVAVGAAATSLIFAIGKQLIGLYLRKAGFTSTYGAAGSLVVLLVWVYDSAQLFFFGAEFTKVYARTYGSHAGAGRNPAGGSGTT